MKRDRPARVIVGVDDSLAGFRALRLAVSEARRRGAVLHALRVWNFDPAWRGSPDSSYQEIQRDAAALVTHAFAEAMGGPPGDIEVVTATSVGLPARVLIQYAYRDDDLLVVGSRQRGWLRRLFRRSVARSCAARASCPVMVVPPDAFARDASREGLKRAIQRDLSGLTG